MCESVLVLLPNKDDEAEVELMVTIAPDVPPSLFLDETYLYRILMNLLSNATKFTRSGYILLLIEMGNGHLTATVEDTGCGVPPYFLPLLFEPFKQAQTQGSQRGTGLGLSIVKQLLHKIQGTIEVESRYLETEEVGQNQAGSTFTIKIPVQISSLSQPTPVHSEASSTIAIFHGGSARSLEGLCKAWEVFGYDVTVVQEFSDLAASGLHWQYVWADAKFLLQHPVHLKKLLEQDNWLVLVPYDSSEALGQMSGLLLAKHFVPLPKPLIWHSFQQHIAKLNRSPSQDLLSRAVKSAANVDMMGSNDQGPLHENATTKELVILLVEDNPVWPLLIMP